MHPDVQRLHAAFNHHTPRRFEVFYTPLLIETFGRRTPEGAWKRASFRWVAAEPGGGVLGGENQEIKAFVALLSHCKIRDALTPKDEVEVRNGVQIEDALHKVIFTLCVDGRQNKALLNGRRVLVGPEVHRWFEDFAMRHFP